MCGPGRVLTSLWLGLNLLKTKIISIVIELEKYLKHKNIALSFHDSNQGLKNKITAGTTQITMQPGDAYMFLSFNFDLFYEYHKSSKGYIEHKHI